MSLARSTRLADRFGVSVAVINALERIAAESRRKQRTNFGAAEVVFHVELDRVYLIEDAFLESSILEHLAVGGSLFFIDDSFDGRIAGDKRCVRDFESGGRGRGGRSSFVSLLPAPATTSTTPATTIGFLRI